jgi:hypothetical protein
LDKKRLFWYSVFQMEGEMKKKFALISLGAAAGMMAGVLVWENGPARVLGALLMFGLPAPFGWRKQPSPEEEERYTEELYASAGKA